MLPQHGRLAMEREYAGGSIGGILRKTRTAPAVAAKVDLLVFGYACKVFRDDEKARALDQGKHLIPWMGDNNLKIDRYDVRGALYELAPFEPPPGGFGNRLDYLSADEQRAEQLCEEERYLFLYNNETELILQQEEDLKRLQQESSGDYNQVAFEYDGAGVGVQHGPDREEHTNSPTCDEAEQAFKLPANFAVPASMQLPDTMKLHAIIEKTARFIADQGVQMEILLKAKQSNNVQFEFLAANSQLNSYYKFIVNAIKEGTYPPAAQIEAASLSADANAAALLEHAAAAAAVAAQKPVITVPMIKYKPSANCAYTQLISKIKGLPLPAALDENSTASGTSSPSNAVAAPVLLQYNGNTFVTESAAAATATPDDEQNSNSNSNSSAAFNVSADGTPRVELLKNSTALALAQDYSDTDDEDEQDKQTGEASKPEPILNFPVPVDNLKHIIDKTATYVIKNGRQFEETLRTKSEERFTFLNADTEYYPYYMYKITGDPDAASKEQKTKKAAAVAAALLSKKGLTDKAVSAVSFSIKSKDETTTASLPLQTVLPQENSDDDDDDVQQTPPPRVGSVPEHVQKAIQLVECQLMARNAQLAVTNVVSPTATLPNAARITGTTTRSRFDIDYNTATALLTSNSTSSSSSSSGTKPLGKSISKAEQERNALFEQQQQNRQRELRKAEEKVKDKLAQIAREKLGGLLSKEKQLQLERKRKALAFLNQIKGTPTDTPSAAPDDSDAVPIVVDKDTAIGAISVVATSTAVSDDSDASVHSIPITSYGPTDKSDDDDAANQAQSQCPLAAQIFPAIVGRKSSAEPAQQISNSNNTVTLSDDDDVQLVSEVKAPTLRKQMSTATHATSRKRTRSRSRAQSNYKHVTPKRSRKRSVQNSGDSRTYTTSGSCSSTDDDHDVGDDRRRHKRSHSKAHKSSTSSTHSKIKKKSKKRARSTRKRSPSRSTDDERRRRHHYEQRRDERQRNARRPNDNQHNSRGGCRADSRIDSSRRQEGRRHYSEH